MTKANDYQEGGKHYKVGTIQHWDFVLMHKMPYMEAQIFKYVLRWKEKNGLEDLRKARHFIDKLIEYELEAQTPVVDVCSGTHVPQQPHPSGLGPPLVTNELDECGFPIRKEEFKVGSGTVVLEGEDLTRARQVLFNADGAKDNDYLNPDTGEPQGKGYVDQD